MSISPRRQLLVPHHPAPSSRKHLLWAILAAVISVGAHAVLIALLLNVKLTPAEAATGEGTVQTLPIIDNDPPWEEKQKPTKDEWENKFDLTQVVPGEPRFEPPIELDPLPPVDPPPVLEPAPTTLPRIDGPDLPGLPVLPGDKIPRLTGKGPGIFQNRHGEAKEQALRREGGSLQSEVRVARGLLFLANHQARDGHWSMHEFNKDAHKTVMEQGVSKTIYEADKSTPESMRRDDIAGTALALLPFLGAGHTQLPVPGAAVDYHKNIKAGLDYLIKSQSAYRDGNFGSQLGGNFMYSHALATIAMCEAYGLTSDPALKLSAQRAINFIENAQHEGGGWRYKPRMPGDLSVTGWMLMALKSGQMAGLNVKPEVLKKADKFLDSCAIADAGGYSYTPGTPERISMTAVGLLCRQYQGVTARNGDMLKGILRLEQQPPDRTRDIYYLYYATQVMHHIGGKSWTKWNLGSKEDGKDGIRDILIGLQDDGKKNADNAGSWMFQRPADGRLMSTSLALLTLEVYYRHLPLYRRDVGQVKGAK